MSGQRQNASTATAKRASALTRRHFIVAGATAAGGLAIGIGLMPQRRAMPSLSMRNHGRSRWAKTELRPTISTPGSRSSPTTAC